MIALYWDIGRLIVDRQQAAGWGKAIVGQLASDIRATFPWISGFSSRNVWRMREFYLSYRDNPKLTPLVAEISWSHNLMILEKCKDDLEREFYIRMTRRYGWTKNVLTHQIRLGFINRCAARLSGILKVLKKGVDDVHRL